MDEAVELVDAAADAVDDEDVEDAVEDPLKGEGEEEESRTEDVV